MILALADLATLRPLIVMGFVLAVVATLAWLVKRGALTLPRRRSPVTVETAVPLGERRSLVIVAVEGRRLLLGLTPAHVSFVTELGTAPADFGATLDRSLAPSRSGQ